MPGTYEAITGQGFSPLICLGLFTAGAGLVLLLESLAGQNTGETSATS